MSFAKIEVGYGMATEDDSREAGEKAARQALESIQNCPLTAVLVFASVRYDLHNLLSGIESVMDGVPVFGASTAGEICNGTHRKSVAVAALASPYLSVGIGIGQAVSEDWQRAVHQAVSSPLVCPYFSLEDNTIWNEMTQKGESAFGIVFSPGSTGRADSRGHEIVEGLRQLSLGRLPIFGGGAADDWLMEANYVFWGGQAYSDSLLVAVFRTSLQFGIAMAHGLHPSSRAATVTKARKHEVLELNGRPADEVYAELLGASKDSLKGKHLTLTTGRPLGIRDTYGDYTITVASWFTPGRGLHLSQAITQGTALTVMEPAREEMLNAGKDALLKAMLRSGVTDPAVVFACSCALRSEILKEPAAEEISRMKKILPGVPLVGFYSFGEYGTTIDGVDRYNNGVITTLLLGRDLSYAARVAEENRRLRTELDTNVAELRQTKEDLSRAEEFLRATVDNLPIAVFAKSAEDYRYILWNKASETLLGHLREQTIGKNDYDLFPKEQADWFREKDRDTLDSGIAIDIPEEPTLTGNRGTRILHTRKVPLFGKHQRPQVLLGITEDITRRKEAEEALKESEEKFRNLFNNAEVGMFRTRLDGSEIVDVNERYLKILGRTREEVQGSPSVIHWADPSEREEMVRRLNADGYVTDFHCKLRNKRGEVRTCITSMRLYREQGILEGSILDVTESKRAEEALQKRVIALTQPMDDPGAIQVSDLFDMEDIQRIQDAFAEATGVASLITTPDGRPITQPSNFCRLCREIIRQTEQGLTNCFKSDAVIGRYNPSGPIVQTCLSGGLWDAGASITVGGKHIANWLIGQVRSEELDENRMLEYAHEIGADPEEFAKALAETPVMSREQFEKVARALFCFANELSMKAYQNVQQARFIADRQKAEALRMRLVTAIEQAAEGVVITDAEGKIQYVNPALEKMTGYDSKELVGGTSRLLKSGEHDQAFYRELWETITRGDVWAGRLVNKQKDGRLYHEEVTISPVRDASGKIVNFVAVKRDITEHLELSRQLQQAQKMESIGTLAGGIAHDFNNILTIVLGFSELLLIGKDERDPSYADLQKINQAARNGADLVKRILAFSRKADINLHPLNLNHEIEQAQKLLARTIPKMVEIELALSEAIATVNGDPTQVEQILMNLVVNAKDAMPDGGKLTIATANMVLDEEYVRTHVGAKAGEYVLLSVSDTGHGMDEETLSHIFEPFYTTKKPGKGTGLGLAVIYGIVKQHGGYITCDSKPRLGTTFKIYLPALVAETDKQGTKTREAIPRGGTETILLVDDEEFIRDLGKRILERSGYMVLSAANGKEALDLYEKTNIHISLVILDLIMPEMGGKQCLEELLKIDPKAQVLIASGFAASRQATAAIEAGARGFVGKPFDVKSMLQAVREVLDSE